MHLACDVYEPEVGGSALCPILLQHSLLESKRTWRAVGQPLARRTGRRVYAIDARNHGDSPWTEEYNYDLMAEDLRDFLEDHGIPKIILIGHSVGGKVAITFALKNPERVEMLIIEDVPVRSFKQRDTNLAPLAVKLGKQVFDDMRQKSSKHEAEQFARAIAKNFADTLVVSTEMIDSYDFSLLPLKWNGTSYDLELNFDVVANALFSGKLQQNISGKFEGDTLFLFGKSSQFKVGKDAMIEKFFPSAVRVGLEGVGHFIHQTFPQEFLQEVVHFINRGNGTRSKY